ncbi:MAG: class I SAM-dependent methyltransferase [Thiohalocapsa sp.]
MPRVDTDSFYRNALARHGHNAEGVHWTSKRTQQVRFEVLRRFLPPDLSAATLVDVGCGLGDLFRYLVDQGDRPSSYVGIDLVAPMVEVAAERTGCRILQLDVLHDELPGAHFYVCSGAMNTLTREESEQFIRRCFNAATRGFVFNLLEGRQRDGVFNHFMPDDLRPLAAELGVEPRFVDGYLAGDFSAALMRGESR